MASNAEFFPFDYVIILRSGDHFQVSRRATLHASQMADQETETAISQVSWLVHFWTSYALSHSITHYGMDQMVAI